MRAANDSAHGVIDDRVPPGRDGVIRRRSPAKRDSMRTDFLDELASGNWELGFNKKDPVSPDS
jgi:hypothetical protein